MHKYKDKKSGRFVEYNPKKDIWFYVKIDLAETDAKSPIVAMQEAYDNATVEYVEVDKNDVILA